NADASAGGLLRDDAGKGVGGAALGGGGQGQDAVLAVIGWQDTNDLEAAFGDGAGLVVEDRVDARGAFEHGTAAHQNAAAREAADGRHHGGGGGQDEGAGAGHDEDGDSAQPVAGEEESQRGGQQEGGQEVAGKAVSEALDGGLAQAGFLDQAGDAGERGVVTGARDA